VTFWLLLGLGGAAGAVARYATAAWVQRRTGPGFPWGTLAVNVTGSFALGVVMATGAGQPDSAMLVAFLATGFLGDFTTFSTFVYEALALGHARAWRRTAVYVMGTTVATVAAVGMGLAIGAGLAG